MGPLEIMLKYPCWNKVWSFDAITGRWITEASDLESDEGRHFDPWNRPILSLPREMWDEENNLLGWIYESSVEKNPIELVVYND